MRVLSNGVTSIFIDDRSNNSRRNNNISPTDRPTKKTKTNTEYSISIIIYILTASTEHFRQVFGSMNSEGLETHPRAIDPALGYRSEHSIQNTEQSLFETQNTEYRIQNVKCRMHDKTVSVRGRRIQNTECRTDHCQP